MAIKVILVPVGEMKSGEAALRLAVDLARRFDAHVEVLHVRADPRNAMPYMGEGMSGAAIQEIMEMTEREEARLTLELRGLFDSLCECGGHSRRRCAPGRAFRGLERGARP